jgi:purine-binding chemotaxis protein CheW
VSARDPLAASLQALREEFDASFAAEPPGERPDDVALLAVRVGNDPLALRVHEILGLLKVGTIVAVPSRRPELLGITGVRGAVVPVYSLARLTGRAESERPRWVALAGAGGAGRIGLAFAALDGHLRVPSGSIHAAASSREPGAVFGLVDLDGESRPLLDVRAIVHAITRPSDRKAG